MVTGKLAVCYWTWLLLKYFVDLPEKYPLGIWVWKLGPPRPTDDPMDESASEYKPYFQINPMNFNEQQMR